MSFAIRSRGQDNRIPPPQNCKWLVVEILPSSSMSAETELLRPVPKPLKRRCYDLIHNPSFESTGFRDILVTR